MKSDWVSYDFACFGMKGTPELATGTMQLIFRVNLRGVDTLMFTTLKKRYLGSKNLEEGKVTTTYSYILYVKGTLWYIFQNF